MPTRNANIIINRKMKKVILTPQQCGLLIPHWPELDTEKLKKLGRMVTRTSSFAPRQNTLVMAAPPILITEENYILNGKHRAFTAAKHGYSLEAYRVQNEHDIFYHTPRDAYEDVGLENVMEAFGNRAIYISFCRSNGINCISDLLE